MNAKKILKTIGLIVLWVIGLLICLLPALFLTNPAGYFPLLAYLLLSLISRLYLFGMKRSLEWEEGSGLDFCRRGERQRFGLMLHNKGPLVFPSLEIRLGLSDLFGGTDSATDIETTMTPFEERSVGMDVNFTHLGSYTVSVEKMKIGSLLGVWSKDGGSGAKHEVRVLPNIWDISSYPLSHQVNEENTKSRQNSDRDGMDYFGVREYEQGDPIRSIHWKLSAHTNAYMTKQMVTIGMTGISVILNLYGDKFDAEQGMHLYDGLIEGACALCNYSLKNYLEHDMLYFDHNGIRRSRSFQKKRDLDRILDDMPKIINIKDRYPVEELLHHAATNLYGKNNVALVTAELSPQIIKQLVTIHMRGRYPFALLVLPKGLTDLERAERLAPLRELDAYNIPWHAFDDAQMLEGGVLG